METSTTRQGGPLRWKAAGILGARLPNTRGRDRITSWTHGRGSYDGPVSGRLHNGLTFSFPDARDGSVRSMMALRYRPPVLAPVLEAVLEPGDCFYDVGANHGIYTLWAAPLVGSSGEVHAFEPVPATRAGLTRMVTQNALTNVTVYPGAAGASDGLARIRTVDAASGLAHLSESPEADLTVQVRSLDSYARSHRAPTLVKIDVEGHEISVLQGAGGLLDSHRPALVLEVIDVHQDRAGVAAAAIPDVLASHGYQLFNLTPKGAQPAAGPPYTVNVLALATDRRHHDVADRLARTGFRRNQTT